MFTAIPETLPPRSSHSPVCRPARTSIPSSRTQVGNRACAPDSTHRSVERREEAVAGRVHLSAPKVVELSANERVVSGEKLVPGSIAKLRRARGRADDVGEQHGREDGLRFRLRPYFADEPSRLLRDFGYEPDRLVAIGELDPASLGHPLRHVARMAGVAWPVDDQRRYPHRREHIADVHVHRHPVHGQRRARARAVSHHVHKPATEAFVADGRRIAALQDGIEVLARSPSAFELVQLAPPFVGCPAPGIVSRTHPFRIRIEQDERAEALWYVAAKSAAIGAASKVASTAARSMPAAADTARTSSIRASRVATMFGRSERPVPRRSKRVILENDAICS